MAARTPKAPNRSPGKTGGGAKKPTPTRAQLKAMEARAASAARASAFARGEDVDEPPASGRASSPARSSRGPRAAGRSGIRAGAERSIGPSFAPEFSVRTEMEYQRRDLVRLLIVAAILVVVYIVLWFFLH